MEKGERGKETNPENKSAGFPTPFGAGTAGKPAATPSGEEKTKKDQVEWGFSKQPKKKSLTCMCGLLQLCRTDRDILAFIK